MGGAFAPGEHLLLVTASSGDPVFHFPATEYPTGHQVTFQLELASSLLRNRPGVISRKLVSLPEAGSNSQLAMKTQALDAYDLTLLKTSDVSMLKSPPCTLAETQRLGPSCHGP